MSHRERQRSLAPPLLAAIALALSGCARVPEWPWREPSPPLEPTAQIQIQVERDAHRERSALLEREVARLRADLGQAEESLVAIESGLRNLHTRADAVSALAEARIAVERAGERVRWRPDEIAEARAKLEESSDQLEAGHWGSAIFFASRARRIAATLAEEADRVERDPDTRFVRAARVNLRSAPSTDSEVIAVLREAVPVFAEQETGDWVLVRTVGGPIGWVYASLLGRR